jgi:hypothetical protein
MADMPDRYYVRVHATALIDGKEMPLQSFAVNYALDEMPKAVLEIALGRGMSGPGFGKTSSGHGLLSSIKPFTPVEIKIKLEADPPGKFSGSGDDDGLKQGKDQTIFKGFVFTPAQTKDRIGSSASLTFQAIGYPAALGGSTQYVRGLTSVVDDKTGASKVVSQLGKGALTLSAVNSFLSHSADKKIVDTFLLSAFDEITDMLSGYNETSANDSAKTALERMSGNPLDTSPLILDYGGVPKRYYEYALSVFYGKHFWEPWQNPDTDVDLWSVLIGLGPHFLYHFVPAIEHDAIAAVTFGLGGEAWRSFEPKDYWKIQMEPDPFSPAFYSYVGKVGLTRPEEAYGFYQEKLPNVHTYGYAEIADTFDLPVGGDVSGRLVTYPPPEFLICPEPPASATGLGGFETPDAADPSTNIDVLNAGGIIDVFSSKSMGNAYANTILRNKLFEHRKCAIEGRFRLDIAPGSLLKIATIGERFVNESEVFYGHAQSVTLAGGNGMLGTRVSLVSLRTETEHERYTVPDHPLYSQAWNGAMLTD